MSVFVGPHPVRTMRVSHTSCVVHKILDHITSDDDCTLPYMIRQINFRMLAYDCRFFVAGHGDFIGSKTKPANLSVAPLQQYARLFINLSLQPVCLGTTRLPPGSAYFIREGVALNATARITKGRMRLLTFLLSPQ